MGFSENLQILRKMKNMSQEQLAERLDISRQAVSKWESGNGYPETDKLISICEIFNCSMDEIIKGKISEDTDKEKTKYETLMNQYSKGIAIAVGVILLGVTILLYFSGIPGPESVQDRNSMIGVVILLLCVVLIMPIFIVLGMENPKIPNFYNEDEIAKFNLKYPKAIALSISLILIGVIFLISLYGIGLIDDESTIPVVVLMGFVTVSVPIMIYFGIQKDKYDIEKYNKENSKEYKEKNNLVGKVCSVIMIIATILFFISGFVYYMWEINWIVFPIGGMMCGIVSTILNKE